MVVCLNKEPWREFCNEPPCGQLNPVNNETYVVSLFVALLTLQSIQNIQIVFIIIGLRKNL